MKKIPNTATASSTSTSVTARRLALSAALAIPVLTGCSSGVGGFASLNPFNRQSATDPSAMDGGLSSGTPASVASAKSTDSTSRLASFTDKTKGTLAKTTSAVGGMFKRDESTAEISSEDPLSLASTPEKVDPKVHVANGQLWESTGKPEKAIESYNRALEMNPKHPEALSNLARLNYRQSNYSAAAELFQKALAESPNDAQLYNELGLTLHKLGRTDMAITVMQRALTIAPNTSRFANNLASVLHESGDINGAYEVLAKNNKPAVAHFNMAYLQYKSGNVADARKHLDETLKFESAAGTDAAVGRAVARGKDMLAQIDALTPAATTPTGNQPPAVAPPAITGGPEALTAQLPTGPASKTASPSTPTTPFGYGWPTAPTTAGVTPASATDSATASVKPANEAAKTNDDAGATHIPAWLREATTTKPAAEGVKKPVRVASPTATKPSTEAAPKPSGFQLPQ